MSTPTVDDLLKKIEWIDALTREAAGNIESLARAATECLKGGNHLTPVYRLLGLIKYHADQLENTVNCEAEAVGAAFSETDDYETQDELRIIRRWQRVEKPMESSLE
ncbi:MAG: hypothetical protein KF822_12660 [Steroidobacteraceae bacterium]|nr:hypothetical protein [Steroidobacteraceae bacterium]